MSRSFKRVAIKTCAKAWNRLKQSAFRHRIKQIMHDIETDFDPDRDWEEANLNNKGLGEYGTRIGLHVKPTPDDSFWDRTWWDRNIRK